MSVRAAIGAFAEDAPAADVEEEPQGARAVTRGEAGADEVEDPDDDELPPPRDCCCTSLRFKACRRTVFTVRRACRSAISLATFASLSMVRFPMVGRDCAEGTRGVRLPASSPCARMVVGSAIEVVDDTHGDDADGPY